nr:DUF3021 family protein [Lachnospiraceae bacterium]
MEKKYNVFDLLGQMFFIFGVTVTCLSMFAILFGADAEGMSTIFALADRGLSVATLGQFLLMSAIIPCLRFVFFTDFIIREWPLLARTISMFGFVVILIGIFAAGFGWFPVNDAKAWIMFFVSFFVSCTISVTLSAWKEKKENQKMQEALERLKKGEM